MSFYLSNSDLHPTGFEPGEFLDLMTMAETRAAADPTPSAAPVDPDETCASASAEVPVSITPQTDGPLVAEGLPTLDPHDA